MDMARPWPGGQRQGASQAKSAGRRPPNYLDAATELSGRRPLNYLAARRAGQCAPIRINDFQTRHELAGLWNGKSRKLITTP
jgi:hypothetical protein